MTAENTLASCARECEGGRSAVITVGRGQIVKMTFATVPLWRSTFAARLSGLSSIPLSTCSSTTPATFANPSPCATLANGQINSGVDIIFPIAGGCGAGALHAAGQAHIYSIGVDLSQKAVDPSVIVSATKRPDMATFDVIKAALGGNFQGGVVRLGLKEEAVGYSVDNFPSGDLPTDIRHKVVAVEQHIELGLLTPPQNLGP